VKIKKRPLVPLKVKVKKKKNKILLFYSFVFGPHPRNSKPIKEDQVHFIYIHFIINLDCSLEG